MTSEEAEPERRLRDWFLQHLCPHRRRILPLPKAIPHGTLPMPTTESPPSSLEIDRTANTREAILRELEEYRALLHEPLPAAEVNERLIQARIDGLLDRLNRLS